jgi:hypothetical protein
MSNLSREKHLSMSEKKHPLPGLNSMISEEKPWKNHGMSSFSNIFHRKIMDLPRPRWCLHSPQQSSGGATPLGDAAGCAEIGGGRNLQTLWMSDIE